MEKSSPKAQRKTRTWTFQPDEDVIRLFQELLPDLSRGEKTKLINEAIRQKHAQAVIGIVEEEVAKASAKLEALKGKAEGKG